MISRLLRFAVVGLLPLSNLVQAGTYAGYTTTARIPFLEAGDPGLAFGDNVHVNMRFSSITSTVLTPFVDTGSCGIIVSAVDLPDWNASEGTPANKGWHYLSSSDRLYSGFWVTRDIYFEVPILAVTKRTKCPSYDPLSPDENCPGTPSEVIVDPAGIRIMGIGFGPEADGQPQGTPDKNPLLHITAMWGHDVSEFPHYWPGYILSKEGITLGLTDTTTESMDFAPLVPGGGVTPHWDLNFSWPELPACIKITAPGTVPGKPTPCLEGRALLDTGVGNGFIRVPSGSITLPRDEVTFNLYTGTHVQVTFGSPGVAGEHFIVGMLPASDPRPVTPGTVRAVYSPAGRRPTFINTSRYIYRKYIVAFDPILGRLGFNLTPV